MTMSNKIPSVEQRKARRSRRWVREYKAAMAGVRSLWTMPNELQERRDEAALARSRRPGKARRGHEEVTRCAATRSDGS